jgi:predicted nucleic acid-binding Zn ribbon protein
LGIGDLIQLQQFSSGVLAEIVRRQPPSPARTVFAWQIAVGPAIARTTNVELADGVLRVNARDAYWAQAVNRAADTILARMQHLLGAESVKTIEVQSGLRI